MRMVMLLLVGCGGESEDDDEEVGINVGGPDALPSMEDCRDWLAQSQASTIAHQCLSDDYRSTLQILEGAVFPLSSDRYYTAWFPPGWDGSGVVVTVPGSQGCPEMMTDLFAGTAQDSYAIISVQLGIPAAEVYDDEDTLYANLQAAHAEVAEHCPIASSPVAYHGFSRGAGRAYGVSLRDAEGAQLFDTFVVDSGTNTTSLLSGWSADTLSESRFWMWCGARDPDPIDSSRMLCEVMEQDMAPWIEAHSGTVDALIEEEGACHGMFFFDCDSACDNCRRRTADNLGPSLPLLFDYLDSL